MLRFCFSVLVIETDISEVFGGGGKKDTDTESV